MFRLRLLLGLVILAGCVPALQGNAVVLTVDNSRCQGTYRNLYIYRNNVILGQVQGEPRKFLSVPQGSGDFKATPTLGTSQPLFKSIKLERDTTWMVCG